MHTFLSALSSAPANSLSAAAHEPSLAGILSVFLILILLALGLTILMVVSMWKIFQKAGKPGWASIVPFYNYATALEIVNKPLWWLPLLMFIPVVNVVLLVIIARRLAAVFGKGPWFTAGMIFLPFIFLPILAFGSAEYNNRYEAAKPMSQAVMWSLITGFVFGLYYLVTFVAGFTSGFNHEMAAQRAMPMREHAMRGSITCDDMSEAGDKLTRVGIYDGSPAEMVELAPAEEMRDGNTWFLDTAPLSEDGYILQCEYGDAEKPVEESLNEGMVCSGRNDTNITCADSE